MTDLTSTSPDSQAAIPTVPMSRPHSSTRPQTYIPIPEGMRLCGDCSRSFLYEKVLPNVRTIHLGKKRLIETASLIAYLDSLPNESGKVM
jgi:hypothetical protein